MNKTIVCAAKLHQNQLERHLELFELLSEVERVLVVRHAPAAARLAKVENHQLGQAPLPLHALRMMREVRRVAARENADWMVGFNPVPWGSLGALGVAGLPTKVCLSLIGMDYQQLHRLWGAPFRAALRAADAVTVTGQSMLEGVARLGVAKERLFVLPHSVDLNRFAPGGQRHAWDVVSVGQLIERKKMDVVIDAVAVLASRGQRIRLGILGKGPLEGRLKTQVRQLGLSDQVDFLGYRDDVEQVLSGARAFCLASSWEGVPFALMEAMASGLVPVVTDVGTISDWVRHRQNGLITPVGDVVQLADALSLVVSDSELASSMRQAIAAERPQLGLEQGAAVWSRILAT